MPFPNLGGGTDGCVANIHAGKRKHKIKIERKWEQDMGKYCDYTRAWTSELVVLLYKKSIEICGEVVWKEFTVFLLVL